MADNNFGLAAYEDILTKNMITYYDNIKYDRNNPIDKRLIVILGESYKGTNYEVNKTKNYG